MYLYHLTLQAATNITTSITGSFSAPRTHEILVARGRVLELLQLNNGKLQSLAVLDVFGVIRSILPFRLTGSNQDYIVIASDSGKISVVEFDKDKKRFKKVHEETFGRSGCRRIVPGQFLAADPRGRAVMIGAIEKQKFVYILNRDNAARLTISSPLEAHKSHNLTFDIIGVDVGFDNPVFASIEVDYTEAEDAEDKLSAEQIPKSLTFYELDLGLNHVVRKWSDRIDPSANMLIPVPGGSDGPGGVLVCAENFVYWKNQGKDDVVAPLPRRSDMDPEKGLLVVNYTMHKRKADSFFLIQTELGDLYKLTLRYTDHVVDLIDIKYFDTVPLASSISLLRLGFLFVAAEAGNHMLYQFQSTGDDDQDNDDAQKKAKKLTDDGQEDEEEEEEITFAEFSPRPLKHLELVDQLESNSPIVDMLAKDIAAEGSPQLFLTSGTNSSSAVKVLRYGLRVSQVASADLPRRATAVWTVKKSLSEEFDNYIVVSFQDETLVLSIGDTVSEVDEAECGFSKASATLYVRQVGEDCLLQVLPTSLRLIRSGNRTVEWKTPSRRAITHSAINQRQVLISTEANELFYFKIDASSQLIEVDKKQFEFQISSLDVEPVSIDRSFSRFAAIGDGDDHKVRVISLDPSDCLQTLSIQSVPSLPSSICLLRMRDETNENQLYLHIGLSDGLLIRSRLHQITGEVSDARRRLLGVRAVKLHRVVINEAPAILALSSRSWLIYNYQQRFNLTPLSTSYLDFACSFTSDQCPEGIVSVTESTLRILSIEGLGSIFNSFQIPLKNTPRKIAHIPDTDLIVTIETDHNQVLNPSQPPPEDWEAEQRVTPTKQGPRKWASLVRLYDLSTNETTDIFELGNNDAAFTLAVCQFADRQQYQIVVGASRNLQLKPRAHDGGALYVFSVQQEEGGGPYKLKLDSKNDTEEIPGAVLPFEGKLLVGAGPSLRLYEMGKRKLLKKAEKKGFPSMIKHLHIHGDRIVVGDLSQSFFFVKYKKFENKFYVFADDVFPRWITSACHVDYDTVAGGDKFGNFFVCRLPKEASNEVEEDPTGSHLRLVSQAPSYGCTHKLQQIVQFHVGEPLTALQRLSLVPGGSEVILYTTIFGGIGMFVPFISREDVDFFQHLEASTRKHQPPLCGRDHQAFRSSYSPVKNVVDGDLCEQYLQLDFPAREEIAGELDRSINEVLKKLEDIRNRCL